MVIKLLRPTKNRQTQGYSSKHRGYDFSGKGDTNIYAPLSGKIVLSKDGETKNWQKPKYTSKGKLSSTNYGNYCKIESQLNKDKVFTFFAHLEPGSVLSKGTEISQGQVIAKMGHVGWSTGRHLHFEARDENQKNFPVVFVDKMEEENEDMVKTTKKQQIIDAYLGARPALPPSDDEINARLQENKNPVEITRDILTGDGNSREYWLDKWEIDTSPVNWEETAKAYQDNFNRLKEIYGLVPSADTEEVLGRASRAQDRIKELEKLQEPKTIYKIDGKNFDSILKIGKYRIILEK